MSIPHNFKGFFSYARLNDKHDNGYLSSLCRYLEMELWVQSSEKIKIFQDQEDIQWGEPWKEKIYKAILESNFLIVIVTPSYLKSETCRFELEKFLDLEKKIGKSRVLPVIYMDTPELKTTNDLVFSELNNRQWVDWTDLRFSMLTSEISRRKIAQLGKRICELFLSDTQTHIDNKSMDDLNIPNSTVTILLEDTLISASAVIEEKKEVDIPIFDNYQEDWENQWQPSFEDNKQKTLTPSIYLPLPKELIHPPQQITITVHSTGDHNKDKLRIKTLYGTLISYHGRDKFNFQIFDNGKGYLIDFPHDSTRICPELLSRLKRIIGNENWRIEDITYK